MSKLQNAFQKKHIGEHLYDLEVEMDIPTMTRNMKR